MGWVGMATSAGIMIAPLLGGVVYAKGGYFSVFAMCFGLLAVDIFLRLSIIEVKEARRWFPDCEQSPGDTAFEEGVPKTQEDGPDIQVAGPPTTTEGSGDLEKGKSIAATDPATVVGSSTADAATQTTGCLMGALRLFALLFSKPRLLSALWGTLAHSIAQTSFDSTLSLFVKSTFHWDSIGAGLVFLTLVLPSFLGPLISGLGDRYGPK
jgi:Major Facilitator Superfamily